MRREAKSCLYCNKPFFTHPNHINQKFCSVQHRRANWKKRHWRQSLDSDNLRRRKKNYKPTYKRCFQCQKEFLPLKFHPYQKYCSIKCRSKYNGKIQNQREKETNAQRIFICIICKKKYHPTQSTQKSCSKRCMFTANYRSKKDNPEFMKKAAHLVRNRRHRIRANGGNFTLEEWEIMKKNCNYTCLKCNKREPEIKLTIDHIIPITKKGKHEKSNIQPLCNFCNSKKYTKIEDINYPKVGV